MAFDVNREVARQTREHFDRLSGLTRTKGAQRGDFKLCREADKALLDYKRFKNPQDRKKITQEYNTIKREYAGKGDR